MIKDIDADLHMPLEQNFQYYSTHEFHDKYIKDCFSAKSFSVLNCDFRSLSANFDTLAQMLSELYFSFLIISLTEIKIKENEVPVINTDIPGYHFTSQPSNSNALIYPFFTYVLVLWGCTYPSSLQCLFILQKRSIRIITLTKCYEHTSLIFKSLNTMKLPDLVTFQIAVFMKKFHNRLLPSVFDEFFTSANDIHDYNTRFSTNQTFGIPKVRTNYGIYDIRFQGAKVWNVIAKDLRKKLKRI